MLAERRRRTVEAAFRREVEHLAAHHAAEPGGARERGDELEPDLGIGMGLRARENVEREGEQPVARQDGGGLVERLVRRRAAAPQVVVVHGGQVVVRERVAVHAFERRRRHQRMLAPDVEQGRAFDHQERAEPLAAAEARIAHGVEQPRRPGPLAVDRGRRQQLVQERFRLFGDLTEAILEQRLDVHAFFHSVNAGHAFRLREPQCTKRLGRVQTFPSPIH